ncbi:MAG: hypothetical protein HS104_11710 [Polyangiaceae bacterium]|nr:hypothetical protein [Polyangiaceae bacterium]MCL4748555.1 hypothetical protein [Myxococcales bacterium]
MSLLDFVNLPDVKQELNRILPDYQRNQRVVRIVEPRNDDGGIRRTIGTAFDYAFRIELERRIGRVQQKSWVAEAGLANLKRRARVSPTLARILRAAGLPYRRTRRLGPTIRKVEAAIRDARAFTKRYVRNPSPRSPTKLKLAAHAFRLARLDAIYRAGRHDKLFVKPKASDLEEIVTMLDAVPWASFKKRRTCLNPTFGEFSQAVGGADADVITGDMLLDIKVKQDAIIDKADIRQVVGYLLLARAARRSGAKLPELKTIGIYFARHSHLWTASVAEMVAKSEFAEVEAWFIERVMVNGP